MTHFHNYVSRPWRDQYWFYKIVIILNVCFKRHETHFLWNQSDIVSIIEIKKYHLSIWLTSYFGRCIIPECYTVQHWNFLFNIVIEFTLWMTPWYSNLELESRGYQGIIHNVKSMTKKKKKILILCVVEFTMTYLTFKTRVFFAFETCLKLKGLKWKHEILFIPPSIYFLMETRNSFME